MSSVPYTEENPNASAGTTGWTNAIFADQSFAVNNDATITKIGFYSTASTSGTYVKLLLKTATDTFDIVVSEIFAHGGTGWEDLTLSSPYVVPSSGAYYAGLYVNETIDYVASQARGRGTGNLTGSGETLTEATDTAILTRVEGTEPA